MSKFVKSEGPRARLEWIRADLLHVDSRYQRPLRQHFVDKIVEEFDPDFLRVLEVSLRKNGTYVILDGQHRHAAIIQLGWADQKVPCLIHEELSLEEEADIFAGANTSRNPTALDKLRARIVAKDETALGIKKSVEEAGYMLDLSISKNEKGLTCATSLERIYAEDGGEALKTVLITIRKAWGYETISRHRDIIVGVWKFLRTYAPDPLFNHPRLVEKLSTVNPTKLLRDALALRALTGTGTSSAGGSGNAECMADMIVRTYNHKLGHTQRLADWSEKVYERRLRKIADASLAMKAQRAAKKEQEQEKHAQFAGKFA